MEAINVLKKLGMTEYEARAYLSLAKLGPSTVREIVLESKLPRNKAYEALQRLEEKHKVISLPVSPKRYKINDPETLKIEANSITESVKELLKVIEQPRNPEFRDLFWVLKGQEAIREKMANESLKVKKEILACATLSKPFYTNIRTMSEAIKKGIKVKLICTFNPNNKNIYKEYLKAGAQLRVFNEKSFGPLLPRMSIYDGIRTRLTIGSPEIKDAKEYITLWTESKAFAQMLKIHYLNMWKQCEPIEKYLKKLS